MMWGEQTSKDEIFMGRHQPVYENNNSKNGNDEITSSSSDSCRKRNCTMTTKTHIIIINNKTYWCFFMVMMAMMMMSIMSMGGGWSSSSSRFFGTCHAFSVHQRLQHLRPSPSHSFFTRRIRFSPSILHQQQHQHYVKNRLVSTIILRRLSSTARLSSSSMTTTSTLDRDSNQNRDDIDNIDDDDTIFALSSGFGVGDQATAVAVVRISGPKAHDVLQKLLTPPTSSLKNIKVPKPRQAALRNLYYKDTLLDQALVLLFKGPNSFTGEDLVELHCHGSRPIIRRLLEEALPSSLSSASVSSHAAPNNNEIQNFVCRVAEPGEFTQRAYKNGKLDLVQVEALADVLTADTTAQVTQALRQLDGQTSARYEQWRSQLISGLAHAEAVIDFGDDEHLGMDDGLDDEDGDMYSDENLQRQQMAVWGDVGIQMKALSDAMHSHLEDGRRGEIIREGVKIAIVGPPNAGKSSLFNLLARKDAAIVSPIAGTTRDVLQLSLDLGGVKCTLYDTAGVRNEDETSDILEIEGMKRAMKVVNDADLVVTMMDATTTTTTTTMTNDGATTSKGDEDGRFTYKGLIDSIFDDNDRSSGDVMLVLNKMDLLLDDDETIGVGPKEQDDSNNLAVRVFTESTGGGSGGGIFQISCTTQDGVDHFLNALRDKAVRLTQGLGPDEDNTSGESVIVESAVITRARHRQHVEAAAAALDRFVILSGQGPMAVDMAAEELRLAASELGRITGAVDVEQVLDELFSTFCIGK